MSTLDNYSDMRQKLQRDGYVQAYTRNARPVFIGPRGDHVWLKCVGSWVFEVEELKPSPAWQNRQKARDHDSRR